MTDNDKMREEFERDHGAALQEIHYCPETDRYVAVDDSDGYALDYAVAMNNEWRVHKRAWQAAKSVPQYDPSTAEVPPPGHPLQKLGEYLSLILDEDEWATAEQHLLAAWAGFSAKSVPVVGEPVAYAVMFVGNDCKIKGEPHRLVGAHTATAHCVDVGTPLVLQPATSITADELERLRKIERLYKGLRELCGYFQDGSDTVIKIMQDDATRSFHLYVDKKWYHGESLEEALTSAIEGSKNENRST